MIQKSISLTIGIALSAAFKTTAALAVFESPVFSYENLGSAERIHVALKGDGWTAQEIQGRDAPYLESVFGDSETMKLFGAGDVKDSEWVKSRMQSWMNRSASGQPHGGLTVFDPETQAPMAHLVAGGGDRPGTSEIAYAMLPDQQGKKLGTKMVAAIVQEWAPEVRRIGLGQGLDGEVDVAIMEKFKCFGGAILNQLDATAHPKNIGSWRILEKNGFGAAVCGVDATLETIDMSATGVETYEALDAAILALFQPINGDPLMPGVRYSLVDHEGNKRIVSYKEQFKSLRFHLERKVA